MNREWLSLIEQRVKQSFADYQGTDLCYHNLQHTQDVVARCAEIAEHLRVPQDDQVLLLAAAWFHDLGHLYGDMQGHEALGALLVSRFLESDVSITDRQRIAQLILATKYPPHPKNTLEKIICDADTYHLGTPQFQATDELVRQEMEHRTGRHFPDWKERSLYLLQQHRFFTTYCRKQLDEGKQANIAHLEENLRRS